MLVRKNTRYMYAVPTSSDDATMAAQYTAAYFEHFNFFRR